MFVTERKFIKIVLTIPDAIQTRLNRKILQEYAYAASAQNIFPSCNFYSLLLLFRSIFAFNDTQLK